MSDTTSTDGGNDSTTPFICQPDHAGRPGPRPGPAGTRHSTDSRPPPARRRGIQGSNDTRTTDENPERVALDQHTTWAYLRTALGLDNDAWPTARRSLAATSDPLGSIDSK